MSDQPTRVSGHCYCGSVTFEVHIPAGERPVFTAYCHCDSCRRAHAAPLYHVVCVTEDEFRITAGEELINAFTKPGAAITRAFTTCCGTRIFNHFPDSWRPRGKVPVVWFPNLLEEATTHALPDILRPRKNNQLYECVLDVEMLREPIAFMEAKGQAVNGALRS